MKSKNEFAALLTRSLGSVLKGFILIAVQLLEMGITLTQGKAIASELRR